MDKWKHIILAVSSVELKDLPRDGEKCSSLNAVSPNARTVAEIHNGPLKIFYTATSVE